MENIRPYDDEILRALDEIVDVDNVPATRKTGKRSSILKQPKTTDDAGLAEDVAKRKSFSSKRRVSFAEKFQVMELCTGNIYDVSGKNDSASVHRDSQSEAIAREENLNVSRIQVKVSSHDFQLQSENCSRSSSSGKHKISSDYEFEPKEKRSSPWEAQAISTESISHVSNLSASMRNLSSEYKRIKDQEANENMALTFLQIPGSTVKECTDNINKSVLSKSVLEGTINATNSQIARNNVVFKNMQEKSDLKVLPPVKVIPSQSDHYKYDYISKEQGNADTFSASLSSMPLRENKENIYIDVKNKNILVANSRHLKFKDKVPLQSSHSFKLLSDDLLKNDTSFPFEKEVQSSDKQIQPPQVQVLEKEKSVLNNTMIFNQSMDLTCLVPEYEHPFHSKSTALNDSPITGNDDVFINYVRTDKNISNASNVESINKLKNTYQDLDKTKLNIEDMELTCYGDGPPLGDSIGNVSFPSFDLSFSKMSSISMCQPLPSLILPGILQEENIPSSNILEKTEIAENLDVFSAENSRKMLFKVPSGKENLALSYFKSQSSNDEDINRIAGDSSNIVPMIKLKKTCEDVEKTKLCIEDMELTCFDDNMCLDNSIANASLQLGNNSKSQKFFAHSTFESVPSSHLPEVTLNARVLEKSSCGKGLDVLPPVSLNKKVNMPPGGEKLASTDSKSCNSNDREIKMITSDSKTFNNESRAQLFKTFVVGENKLSKRELFPSQSKSNEKDCCMPVVSSKLLSSSEFTKYDIEPKKNICSEKSCVNDFMLSKEISNCGQNVLKNKGEELKEVQNTLKYVGHPLQMHKKSLGSQIINRISDNALNSNELINQPVLDISESSVQNENHIFQSDANSSSQNQDLPGAISADKGLSTSCIMEITCDFRDLTADHSRMENIRSVPDSNLPQGIVYQPENIESVRMFNQNEEGEEENKIEAEKTHYMDLTCNYENATNDFLSSHKSPRTDASTRYFSSDAMDFTCQTNNTFKNTRSVELSHKEKSTSGILNDADCELNTDLPIYSQAKDFLSIEEKQIDKGNEDKDYKRTNNLNFLFESTTTGRNDQENSELFRKSKLSQDSFLLTENDKRYGMFDETIRNGQKSNKSFRMFNPVHSEEENRTEKTHYMDLTCNAEDVANDFLNSRKSLISGAKTQYFNCDEMDITCHSKTALISKDFKSSESLRPEATDQMLNNLPSESNTVSLPEDSQKKDSISIEEIQVDISSRKESLGGDACQNNILNPVQDTNSDSSSKIFDSVKPGILYVIKKLKAIDEANAHTDDSSSLFPEIFFSLTKQPKPPTSFSCTKVELSTAVQKAIRRSCSFNYDGNELSFITETRYTSVADKNDNIDEAEKALSHKSPFNICIESPSCVYTSEYSKNIECFVKNDTDTISQLGVVHHEDDILHLESDSILDNSFAKNDNNSTCSKLLITSLSKFSNNCSPIQSILEFSPERIPSPQVKNSADVQEQNLLENVVLGEVLIENINNHTFEETNESNRTLQTSNPEVPGITNNETIKYCAKSSKSDQQIQNIPGNFQKPNSSLKPCNQEVPSSINSENIKDCSKFDEQIQNIPGNLQKLNSSLKHCNQEICGVSNNGIIKDYSKSEQIPNITGKLQKPNTSVKPCQQDVPEITNIETIEDCEKFSKAVTVLDLERTQVKDCSQSAKSVVHKKAIPANFLNTTNDPRPSASMFNGETEEILPKPMQHEYLHYRPQDADIPVKVLDARNSIQSEMSIHLIVPSSVDLDCCKPESENTTIKDLNRCVHSASKQQSDIDLDEVFDTSASEHVKTPSEKKQLEQKNLTCLSELIGVNLNKTVCTKEVESLKRQRTEDTDNVRVKQTIESRKSLRRSNNPENQATNMKGCIPVSSGADEIIISEDEFYEQLNTLRRKILAATENKRHIWYLRELNDKEAVFELFRECVFGCYVMYVPLQFDSHTFPVKVSFQHLKDDPDEVDEIGLYYLESLISFDLENSPLCADKFIYELFAFTDAIKVVKALMKDIWLVSIENEIRIDYTQGLPRLWVEIIHEDEPFSVYSLTFTIDFKTYPQERIVPEIQHLEFDMIEKKTILAAIQKINPGANYLYNMVEASYKMQEG